MKFSDRIYRLEDEIFAALNERKLILENQGKKIYNLSIAPPKTIARVLIKLRYKQRRSNRNDIM